jgi:hypothetical protein
LNGAMMYAHYAHPGGCSGLVNAPEASFWQLTDATFEPDTCKTYNFDDRSPLTDGPGLASACGSNSNGTEYIFCMMTMMHAGGLGCGCR